MRKVELKSVEVKEPGEGLPVRLDYKTEILTLLKIPVQGMTIDQMELPLRIIPKVRNANGHVTLEEDEHKYLLGLISSAQFRFVIPEIVELRNAIRDAPEVRL